MASLAHKSVLLPNRSYQAVARVELKKAAQAIGFEKYRLAEIEIIIAELTSNLVKHADKGGEILVAFFEHSNNSGIEFISIDEGPGMVLPLKMLEDGKSTTGTLGQGLGAIKRLSDEFDIYSCKNWGTIVVSRAYLKKKKAGVSQHLIETRALMVPKAGETACGDSYYFLQKNNQLKVILADGLGHGPAAAEASQQAIHFFLDQPKITPVEQLKYIHENTRKTRGSVIGIAHVDFANKQILFGGIGNITTKLFSFGRTRSCMSYNGIVGHSAPASINNHTYSWDRNDILIMHSDGINSRWDLQKYPGILQHDGSVLAAALYKDHNRKNDDVTAAIIRYNVNRHDD